MGHINLRSGCPLPDNNTHKREVQKNKKDWHKSFYRMVEYHGMPIYVGMRATRPTEAHYA